MFYTEVKYIDRVDLAVLDLGLDINCRGLYKYLHNNIILLLSVLDEKKM